MNEIKCPKCGTIFQINETDYDTYVCNFYEDTVFVYLIVDDVIGTDYGIIKFRK